MQMNIRNDTLGLIVVVVGIIIVIGILNIALMKANRYINNSINNPVPVQTPRQLAEEIVALKIKMLQDSVLATLALCETGSVEEPTSAIVLDSNNHMSIGEYQFQIKTVQYFYQMLYGTELTRTNAIYVAIDSESSRDLARDIIFNTVDGIDNWYNCDKKHNLSAQIELINRLK